KNPGSKVIIFSEFLCALDAAEVMIEDVLGHDLIVRYDGTMNEKHRKAMRTTFEEDASKRIFLVTIKSSGEGLSMTAADTVIHLSRTWSPAVREQGNCRAIRDGQTRDVLVLDFHSHHSIERKVKATQVRK
ncbi:hypothetical protein CC80DRAFT_355241, partial [Byssothecium circinans]